MGPNFDIPSMVGIWMHLEPEKSHQGSSDYSDSHRLDSGFKR
jgi:hypothetical protein